MNEKIHQQINSIYVSSHLSDWVIIFFLYTLYSFYILLNTIYIFFCFILGPYPQHIEVPKLGVESELQLPAYTATIATPDPSCIWDLYPRSWQCWILNLLSEARN